MLMEEASSRAGPEGLGGRECDYGMHRISDGGDMNGECIVTGHGLGVWQRVLVGHGRAAARADLPGSLDRRQGEAEKKGKVVRVTTTC